MNTDHFQKIWEKHSPRRKKAERVRQYEDDRCIHEIPRQSCQICSPHSKSRL